MTSCYFVNRVTYYKNKKINNMLIKEAEYIVERVVRRKCIKEAVYGCDCCEKEIQQYPNEDNRLEMTLFQRNDEAIRLHFCSWECVLEYLKTVKSDFFVSLPHVYFGKKHAGKRGGEHLQELLRNR